MIIILLTPIPEKLQINSLTKSFSQVLKIGRNINIQCMTPFPTFVAYILANAVPYSPQMI